MNNLIWAFCGLLLLEADPVNERPDTIQLIAPNLLFWGDIFEFYDNKCLNQFQKEIYEGEDGEEYYYGDPNNALVAVQNCYHGLKDAPPLSYINLLPEAEVLDSWSATCRGIINSAEAGLYVTITGSPQNLIYQNLIDENTYLLRVYGEARSVHWTDVKHHKRIELRNFLEKYPYPISLPYTIKN
jgi:hypothetical protein